jgi:hypothetical protein
MLLVILTIPINEVTKINWTYYGKFVGYQNLVQILYCGMPNENTFSITSNINVYNAINLYYPKNINVFTYEKTNIKVLEVNPLYLKIDILNPWYKK